MAGGVSDAVRIWRICRLFLINVLSSQIVFLFQPLCPVCACVCVCLCTHTRILHTQNKDATKHRRAHTTQHECSEVSLMAASVTGCRQESKHPSHYFFFPVGVSRSSQVIETDLFCLVRNMCSQQNWEENSNSFEAILVRSACSFSLNFLLHKTTGAWYNIRITAILFLSWKHVGAKMPVLKHKIYIQDI